MVKVLTRDFNVYLLQTVYLYSKQSLRKAMELKIYPLLSNSCQKLMLRHKHRSLKKKGQIYHYRPHSTTIERLAQELQLTQKEVRSQFLKERLFLLREIHGSSTINEGHV